MRILYFTHQCNSNIRVDKQQILAEILNSATIEINKMLCSSLPAIALLPFLPPRSSFFHTFFFYFYIFISFLSPILLFASFLLPLP